MSAKDHWEQIYETKAPTQVSWYQEHAQLSLKLIQNTGIHRTDQIIDVGAGTSTLVDDLLDAGFEQITVLDISSRALRLARERLGNRASQVNWIEADITKAALPAQAYDLWHDRAVFHFLTQPAERQRYLETLRRAVRPGGHVIIAAFAADGPDHCSGLNVIRYDPESLHSEFDGGFELLDSKYETHHTPFGTEQKFIYCYFRKG
jgi:ubiquinone/menaquinone biosynthesis C-methylase UbiE